MGVARAQDTGFEKLISRSLIGRRENRKGTMRHSLIQTLIEQLLRTKSQARPRGSR